MSEPLISSFLVSHLSESLRSLTKNKRCELIAQVTHQKWVTMSDSLTSLRGNEQSWANRSGGSPKMSKWVNRSFYGANRWFAHLWAKNERFARKTDEQIPSPDFKAALPNLLVEWHTHHPYRLYKRKCGQQHIWEYSIMQIFLLQNLVPTLPSRPFTCQRPWLLQMSKDWSQKRRER